MTKGSKGLSEKQEIILEIIRYNKIISYFLKKGKLADAQLLTVLNNINAERLETIIKGEK